MAKFVNDSVHWYMSELTSRIVAETGIPSDRFHLGKIMMQCMKDDPDLVLQTDGATDESETSSSILTRAVRCAISLRNLGLKAGDVMVLMAPNHIDLAIPFYAALFNGISIAAVDRTLGLSELQSTFYVDRPKVIFCQSEKASDIQITLNELDLNAQIVIFDRGDYLLNFNDFMDLYGGDTAVDYFKSRYNTFPGPTRLALLGAPLQWLTAIITFVASTVMRYPRLMTSEPLTQESSYHLINKYKPGDRDQCDFTCFDLIMLGGSAVPDDLVQEIKIVTPNTDVVNAYGMSEITNIAFHGDRPAPGSCGKPMGCLEYRLVEVETMDDINEPNIPGELWLKGPGIFKEYYNNPTATEETFAEGRWFKTGDMFYRDDKYNYFFVERIKLLLKYNSYQISPVELEAVIRQHPGVLDVAVTGIPDPECGELPV
ncbi:Luciferase, partial [Operophtera brumata]